MKLHALVNNAYQTFLDQYRDARIILFHPHSRYRSILLAQLINSPEFNTYYYALGPDDINLQAFVSGMSHDLANQHPTFGRHTNMLPQEIHEYPEDHFDLVLETFVNDLAEISDDEFLLILDEYDRSDTSDEIQRFVEQLSSRSPDQCRIVLNSRTLPRLPWIAMIAEKRAVMLEDEYVITDSFYGISNSEDENALEVYALGPGFVLKDGEAVDNWEGHLPRLLFFFALDRPVVTRSEICQAFWPELESDQAVNVFHVTKRRLHKALDTDVLIHDEGYYRVNADMPIYYDVMEFASALVRGRNDPDPDNRMAAWQRASELYRGPFLQGHNDAWILERREEYLAGYLEALYEMAHIWVERGRSEQALALLQKGLAADNSREDLHREVMQLYMRLGRRSEAAAHYKNLMEQLRREKSEPAEDTHALYVEIMG